MTRQRRRERGFVLLTVLACLAVATALILGWAKLAVVSARQSVSAVDRLEAEWLAEAALSRAAAQWLADPAYRGETWQISEADLGTRQAAEGEAATASPVAGLAQIAVEPAPEPAGGLKVRVVAEYPTKGAKQLGAVAATHRIVKEIVFQTAAPASNPAGK
jgi:Tfp pilus assembly protein PilX